MSISVAATGLVVEGPAPLLGEDASVVFVLDPFPGLPGARLAHACEVVSRPRVRNVLDQDLRCGDQVEVIGHLVMERVDGPVEDDLSAVRVWIEATRVSVLQTEEE